MKKYILIITLISILNSPLMLISACPDLDGYNWGQRDRQKKKIDELAATALASTTMTNQEKLESLSGDEYWPDRKTIIQDMIDNQRINVNDIHYQYSKNPLKESLLHRDPDFTQYLLQQDANVLKKNTLGLNPLQQAIDRVQIVHDGVLSTAHSKIIKMLILSHKNLMLKSIIHVLDKKYPHIKNLIERTLQQKEIWQQLVSDHISANPASIVADYSKPHLFLIEDDAEPMPLEDDATRMQLEEVDPT